MEPKASKRGRDTTRSQRGRARPAAHPLQLDSHPTRCLWGRIDETPWGPLALSPPELVAASSLAGMARPPSSQLHARRLAGLFLLHHQVAPCPSHQEPSRRAHSSNAANLHLRRLPPISSLRAPLLGEDDGSTKRAARLPAAANQSTIRQRRLLGSRYQLRTQKCHVRGADIVTSHACSCRSLPLNAIVIMPLALLAAALATFASPLAAYGRSIG
jgi:hypothetical protein